MLTKLPFTTPLLKTPAKDPSPQNYRKCSAVHRMQSHAPEREEEETLLKKSHTERRSFHFCNDQS